jgi:hypothetical protein
LRRFSLVLLIVFSHYSPLSAQAVRAYSIEVSCKSRTLNSSQSILEFKWPSRSPAASAQNVYRKGKDRYEWGSVYKSIGTNDSTFKDTISTGMAYEYMFEKIDGPDGWAIYGYSYSGHRFPMVSNRGTILVLIDSTHRTFLSNELRTYRNDLIGDGWKTVVNYFSPSTTVAQIKSYIYSTYSADPNNVKSVVLIGNLAVPYSGNFSQYGTWPPDGHVSIPGYGPSHEGAWPTDIYYGDMVKPVWKDSAVTNTLGVRPANHNVPNDGKFDVTDMENIIQLQVGRIDLSEMSAFKLDVPDTGNVERELLKRYFTKNHSFKHKLVNIRERCLWDIDNAFPVIITGGFFNEHFPSNAYRNMSTLIADTVTYNLDYRSTLNSQDYLWSFGFGFGSYNNCSGVASTAQLANTSQSIRSVFSGFMGSFFGDWDTANSFLRAPLAAKGNTLNTFWSGRPHWFFHHMGLGESIGYSTLRTQNNNDSSYGYAFPLYPTTAFSMYSVHSSLMGDPTVRMQPFATARNFRVVQDSCNNRFKLKWSASLDTAVHTYYIYRARHIDSAFTNIGNSSGLSYVDNSPLTGTNVYMLRALKLQVSGSGTYFNLGQGLFDTVSTTEYSTPNVNAGRDTTVCRNQTVKIGIRRNNNIHTRYLWTPGAYTSDTVSVSIPSTGSRILVATDTMSGCIKRDTIQINTIALPANELISNTSNFCSDTVTWSSSTNNGSSFRYEWSFAGGNPNDTVGFGLNAPGQILYGSAGTYTTTLLVRDTSTGCASNNTGTVSVICVGLPVDWADLQCKRVGENAEISYNINEYETIKDLHIEVLTADNEWYRIETIKLNNNGRYTSNIANSAKFMALRLVADYYNGETDELDNCFWDLEGIMMLVYPNPVSSELHIDFKSNNFLPSSVAVFNGLGQPVYTSQFNFSNGQLTINSSDWSHGLYTVVINTGKKIYSQQFVK